MPYLAMTAAELRGCSQLPQKIGWMACHFSPYGTGLSNLPTDLPKGSLLILNDRTPIYGHDPQRIFAQLMDRVDTLKCQAVLLDLQRPCSEARPIIEKLLTLPCTVVVSEIHGKDLDCPIFLPPVPILTPVAEYLAKYSHRDIWLEAALDGRQITVTETGSDQSPIHDCVFDGLPHRDTELFCHYRMDISQEQAVFTLQRTKEDLQALLLEAKNHGVTNTVGLYQELGR